ncbi:hypothetical protein CEXT_593671 [Caerostris extrusa]|uniref:Uncharacterized protein n=1 Tax=Caerostris extrusa TaxID=172846 RepID=A0AAV4VDK2_CAEEX|nr:hypothetical protein CEXT_593671 [Caerostris extrusa]
MLTVEISSARPPRLFVIIEHHSKGETFAIRPTIPFTGDREEYYNFLVHALSSIHFEIKEPPSKKEKRKSVESPSQDPPSKKPKKIII